VRDRSCGSKVEMRTAKTQADFVERIFIHLLIICFFFSVEGGKGFSGVGILISTPADRHRRAVRGRGRRGVSRSERVCA